MSYTLRFAYFLSYAIYQIVEFAYNSLWDYVSSSGSSSSDGKTEVQFWIVSAIFVFADFTLSDTNCCYSVFGNWWVLDFGMYQNVFQISHPFVTYKSDHAGSFKFLTINYRKTILLRTVKDMSQ